MNPPSTYLSNWRHSPFQSSQLSLFLKMKDFKFYKHQVRWMHLSLWSLSAASQSFISFWTKLPLEFSKTMTYNSPRRKQYLCLWCHNVESPGSWHHSSLTWTPKALPMAGLRYYGFLFSLSFIKSPLYGW